MTQPPTGTAPEVAEAGFQSWLDRVIVLTGLGAGLAALVFAAEQAVWLDRRWLAVVAGALLVSSLLLPVGAWSRWGLRRPTVVYAGIVAVRLWTWPLARRALAGGAEGVCRKAEPVAQTIEAILAVHSGQQVISQKELAAIEGDAGYVAAALGPREREVLSLYAAGLEIPAIGRTLYITENSVKEYLKRIRAKYTQVDRPAVTKLDLFRRAVEDGIVPPIEPRI